MSDLLKVAQVDAGKIMFTKDYVNLNDMVYDAIYDMRGVFAARHQEVEFEAIDPPPLAFIDHDSIRFAVAIHERRERNAQRQQALDSLVQLSSFLRRSGSRLPGRRRRCAAPPACSRRWRSRAAA